MFTVSHHNGMTRVCDACGNEFDPPADVCPLCGGPPSADASGERDLGLNLAGRVRTRLPTDTDRFYHAAIVLTTGYAVSALFAVTTTNTALFVFSLALAIGSIVSMYLDLFGLETRFYDTRPALWVVGAVLMYFLVVPLYLYKRGRHVRSPVD